MSETPSGNVQTITVFGHHHAPAAAQAGPAHTHHSPIHVHRVTTATSAGSACDLRFRTAGSSAVPHRVRVSIDVSASQFGSHAGTAGEKGEGKGGERSRETTRGGMKAPATGGGRSRERTSEIVHP